LPVLSPARISVSSALQNGCDDPEILPSRKPLNCLKGADGRHLLSSWKRCRGCTGRSRQESKANFPAMAGTAKS
ncbi:hypothetical protein, partial [Bosea rubneri]